MNKFVIIVSFLCLTFVLVIKISLHSQSLKEKSPLDFSESDIKGKAVYLSDYKGNVISSVDAGSKYSVSLPLFSKNIVIGKGKSALYKLFTDAEADPNFSVEITWNFEKFLLGRDGDIIARYKPKTRPDDPEVISAIEKLLSKK